MKPMHLSPLVLAVTMIAVGCSGTGADQVNPNEFDPDTSGGGLRSDGEGSKLSDIPGVSLFGNNSNQGGGGIINVNKHLWRASLDTLAFLPLNTTDPITGVIATDWASTPEAPEERFKVTAYVNGAGLSANALQVAVFREIRDPAGAWTTAAVSGAKARQLEDAILVKARQLRIAEREGS